MGCYGRDDRAAQRSLRKQVYRACQATQAQLWERIGPRYPHHAKEGRKLIAAALRAPGSMRLPPGQIGVELAPQPPPTALEWSPNFVKVIFLSLAPLPLGVLALTAVFRFNHG